MYVIVKEKNKEAREYNITIAKDYNIIKDK